ncbi:MAG: DNA-binding protein [Betaproteobacteria bacterium]|nr:DNA-binding protein [Betaproteobacteria bacterium]
MDTTNASTYIGLSEKTLAMMRCNGSGPKFVKRGRVFYFQVDIDAWMNAQGRHTSTARAAANALRRRTRCSSPASIQTRRQGF